MDVSGNMLLNPNVRALGGALYICSITATLKFIYQIILLKDRERILIKMVRTIVALKQCVTEEETLSAIS